MRPALLILALALATPAAAQTETTCTPDMVTHMLRCATTEAPQHYTNEFADAVDRQDALNHRQAAQALQSQVGRLLADGKCDEARSTALKAGDIALAQQVNGYCQGR